MAWVANHSAGLTVVVQRAPVSLSDRRARSLADLQGIRGEEDKRRLILARRCVDVTDSFVHVLDQDALPVGTMKTVKVDGKSILLANVEGEVLAIGAICTHASQDLAKGDLDGDTVICPLHFSSFSLRTGEALDGPARRAEPVFSVRVTNGQVLVDLTPVSAAES